MLNENNVRDNKQTVTIITVCLLLLIVTLLYLLSNRSDTSYAIEKMQGEIRQHQKKEDSLQKVYVAMDSLLRERERRIEQSVTKIKASETLLQQIPTKYVKVRDSLISLNTDEQFRVFSEWIPEIDSIAYRQWATR